MCSVHLLSLLVTLRSDEYFQQPVPIANDPSNLRDGLFLIMNQEAFNFSPLPPANPYTRALAVLHADPLGFCLVTEGWLLKNKYIWLEFYNAAERIRLSGRQRYGAKAITEWMRFETAIRDASVIFKINNNHVSGLARLYNRVCGVDYFETRQAA